MLATIVMSQPPGLHPTFLRQWPRTKVCQYVVTYVAQGRQPERVLLEEAVDSTRHHLRRIEPSALTGLLEAFHQVGYRPDEPWLEDFDTAMSCATSKLSAAQVASVLWAMVGLNFRAARFPAFASHQLHSGGLLEAASYQELSLILRCLNALGLPLEESAIEDIGCRMARLLSAMTADEVAAVMSQELSRQPSAALLQAMEQCPIPSYSD